MVRIVRVIGITLVALLALGGVASGHEFESSVSGALSRVSNTNQVFTTGGGNEVVCTEDSVTGSAVAGKVLHILVSIGYLKCTVKVSIFSFPADVSTAKYLLSADGLVKLENTVSINILGICNLTIKPQHFATGVAYKNNGNNVVEESNVTGIVSEGSGGECKGGTTGTYTGNTEVALAGGKISWK